MFLRLTAGELSYWWCFTKPGIVSLSDENSLAEVESKTQPLRPRPKTQKKTKDQLLEDRPSRGQGQECSKSRRKCSPKKKKVSPNFFRRLSEKGDADFPRKITAVSKNRNHSCIFMLEFNNNLFYCLNSMSLVHSSITHLYNTSSLILMCP